VGDRVGEVEQGLGAARALSRVPDLHAQRDVEELLSAARDPRVLVGFHGTFVGAGAPWVKAFRQPSPKRSRRTVVSTTRTDPHLVHRLMLDCSWPQAAHAQPGVRSSSFGLFVVTCLPLLRSGVRVLA